MNTQVHYNYDPFGQAAQLLQLIQQRRGMDQQQNQFDQGMQLDRRRLDQQGSQFDADLALRQALQAQQERQMQLSQANADRQLGLNEAQQRLAEAAQKAQVDQFAQRLPIDQAQVDALKQHYATQKLQQEAQNRLAEKGLQLEAAGMLPQQFDAQNNPTLHPAVLQAVMSFLQGSSGNQIPYAPKPAPPQFQ